MKEKVAMKNWDYDILSDRAHFFKMIQVLESEILPSASNFTVSSDSTTRISSALQNNCIYVINVATYKNNKVEVNSDGLPKMTNYYGGKTNEGIDNR